jgi:RNA polymerase sigma factor (sigma-70 family)
MVNGSRPNTPAAGVVPYVNVGGASNASDFCQRAFGAKLLGLVAEDSKRLMHCPRDVDGRSLYCEIQGTSRPPVRYPADTRRGARPNAIAARAFGAIRTPRGAEISIDNGSDESLVARVAEGDRRAIQLLFARYQQRVYRFVLRLVVNSATAEDIVSDVFIDLWRHAASFEGRAQLSTWLLAIARNKALSAMRGRVDQPLEDGMAEAIPDPAITAEETLDASKRGAVLRKCLERLSAPRDHRPRLLPREIGRRGLCHYWRAGGDR